jgi:hypothetical protein
MAQCLGASNTSKKGCLGTALQCPVVASRGRDRSLTPSFRGCDAPDWGPRVTMIGIKNTKPHQFCGLVQSSLVSPIKTSDLRGLDYLKLFPAASREGD